MSCPDVVTSSLLSFSGMTLFSTTTDHLTIRPYQPPDQGDFLALVTDPQVMRHVEDGRPMKVDRARGLFEEFLKNTTRRRCTWAAVDRGSHLYCGHGWLTLSDDECELGCIIHPDYQMRGYGTELARAMVRYALSDGGMARVSASVDIGHHASIRMLEKTGMVLQREERDEQGAYLVYATSRMPE